MSPVGAGMTVTVVCETMAVIGLWLRLRWKTALLQAHQLYMVELARSLPIGSRIEENRGDGMRTSLTVGSAGNRWGRERY
jgi:hypothetical protein